MRYQSVVFKFAQDDEENRLMLPQEEKTSEGEEESLESCQECGEAVTAEEMRDPGHQDDRGRFYCSNCVRECGGKEGGCGEKHPVSEMLQGMSSREFYCEECFNDLFVTCPACDELVSSDDFYQPSSQQARSRHDDRREGGCSNCSIECNSCNKVVSKDEANSAPGDSDSYCGDCFWEYYTTCIECNDTISQDSATYVEGHDGEYCEHCYSENFYTCYECNEPVEKNESVEFEDEMYHPDCAPVGAQKVIQLEAEINPEALPSFTYTKKDRLLAPLSRLLPISVKDLKAANPALASGLSDLINFAKGATLTPEVVEAYKATLSPEEFPVEYSTWKGMQRSVRSNKPQLVLKILASEQMLNKLREKPVLIDLFNSINNYFSTTSHPSSPTGIGWARVEISPDKEYMLVDEIQMDHMNTIFKIKNNDPRFSEMVRKIKSNHHLSDEELYKQADQFLNILKDFPNIASVAVERFAKQNGIKRIFWHTYESGMNLKGNKPPKSLYTTTPKEHFYLPSAEKPFGLSGEFFSKEAKKAYMLYKLAKLWNKRY